MRKRMLKSRAAAMLTASLVLGCISPMAGYGATYTEAPIFNDDFGVPYELTNMPDVTVSVEIPNKAYQDEVSETEGEYSFRIPYEVSVDFDELASDSQASPDDWNPEAWEGVILNDLNLFARLLSMSDELRPLDIKVELDEIEYEIVISVGNPEMMEPGKVYTIKSGLSHIENEGSYPGNIRISVDESPVILELTKPRTGEDIPAVPGQSPHWYPDNPGWAGWSIDSVPEELKEDVRAAEIMIYRDGERLDNFISPGYDRDEASGDEFLDIRQFFTESGSYTFQVRLLLNSGYLGDDEFWSDMSEEFPYTVPDKSLPKVTGLKWNSDGSMKWDGVNHNDSKNLRYYIELLRKDGDEYVTVEYGRRGKNQTTIDMSSSLESGVTYKFRVLAEGDLVNYGNSPWSDFSPEFTPGTSEEIAENILDNLLEASDEEIVGNIENTVLEEEQKGALKLGVQTDTALADKYTELEKKYNAALGDNKVDFAVDAKEESKVDGSQVTITGGILNGATGIRFTEPSKEDMQHAGANPYRRKTAVNIKLLPETVTGELKYPVLITMPVPEGMDAEDVIIIHIRNGKEPEQIWPRDNKDGTVSFAVTEFSTFFFADSTSDGSGSGGSSGGSGGGGSTGSSSGAVITTDARKGKVSSVSGIITGSTDGYSKWVSEAPLAGQTENRWKLQYADGTFAAGGYVMDEQGNLVKDAAGNPTEQPMWELINGAWFAFGADGYIKTGLFFDPALNGWFYVDVNAGMKTGWQMADGNWRYFNPVSDGTKGIMFVNRGTPDGYQVNEAGIWVQ